MYADLVCIQMKTEAFKKNWNTLKSKKSQRKKNKLLLLNNELIKIVWIYIREDTENWLHRTWLCVQSPSVEGRSSVYLTEDKVVRCYLVAPGQIKQRSGCSGLHSRLHSSCPRLSSLSPTWLWNISLLLFFSPPANMLNPNEKNSSFLCWIMQSSHKKALIELFLVPLCSWWGLHLSQGQWQQIRQNNMHGNKHLSAPPKGGQIMRHPGQK